MKSCFLYCRSQNQNLADFSIKIEADIYAALCCTLPISSFKQKISFWIILIYFCNNLGKSTCTNIVFTIILNFIMKISFNLFIVVVLTSIHVLPLFEVTTGLGVASIGQVFETLLLPRTLTY